MSPSIRAAVALIAAVAAALPARSDERGARVPLHPRYAQECAACHVPYPPGLLPAASWQRLMNNLPQHFGTDASLDAASVAELSKWLQAHASRRSSEAPPEDRITRSAWFVREHREVPRAAWQRASVRSASNCAACHGGASEGNYDEDQVRIPR